jgi:hypothetical protein
MRQPKLCACAVVHSSDAPGRPLPLSRRPCANFNYAIPVLHLQVGAVHGPSCRCCCGCSCRAFAQHCKGELGTWVTERTKILRQSDLVCLVAVWPLDWFGFLCGLRHEQSVWLRVNKMLLFVSKISPKHVLYGSSQQSVSKIIALLATMFFILHICACTWYWIGAVEFYYPALFALSLLGLRNDYCKRGGQFCTSSKLRRNRVDDMLDIVESVCRTLFRYVLSEISSLVMSADEAVVHAHEHLERVTMFIAGKLFSPELRSEIRAHFKSHISMRN